MRKRDLQVGLFEKNRARDDMVDSYFSLAEAIDTSCIEDCAIKELIEKERQVPVVLGINESLRPKIIDSCGMTCTFCHNEGTPVASSRDKTTLLPLPGYRGGRVSVFEETNGVNFVPGRMAPDNDFVESLRDMGKTLEVTELHLTGGEPTLHPQLPELIRQAAEAGFKVKITSNGENGKTQIEECAKAGLEKINFSIFGTTPEELAEVQHSKYSNTRLAEAKLNALHESIETAVSCGIKVDANIVMSTFEHAERVARVLDKYGNKVSVRILNNLDNADESYLAIYKFLAMLDAEPVELYVEAGTSNSRVKYQLPDGTELYFKQIRRTTLPETCAGCYLNNPADCNEGFYGVRLYVDNKGTYKAGVCLQRMDLTSDIKDFLDSGLPEEILNHRNNEYILLADHYKDRLRA